ncbi:phosphonatase-like hydrolase [Arthrobacter alpinus]|uniref:Phosphonatase-like hydrolase n=1 Tax=Arthrobacter alpinus TaxID=656366 RepID=A0A1H5MZF3_9MICC|nr:phosphonatase-like hydrolase [Arthrobacter alpinus]SEE94570.1 phosphonatase-like hydrolase [Arthrobacter alpinus]
MIELAVFDMAGTTVDDHGIVYIALKDAVEETGATVATADLQEWMGADKISAITALMRLGNQKPTEQRVAAAFVRFREILAERYAATPPVALPGVEEAMAILRGRGIKVALTTGFDDAVAYPLLESLRWAVGAGTGTTVDAVVTTSDVVAGRPAPFMIHRAMEKTGVHNVRKVLAAGDTVVDVQAGRNAGGISVGVLTGKLSAKELAAHSHDYILAGVVDIPELAETQSA